jgi:ABC-2 type transport system ATP-binding protein
LTVRWDGLKIGQPRIPATYGLGHPAPASNLRILECVRRKMDGIETFNLTRHFNGLVAVDGIDLKIGEGELFSLLGPNGAGKTTTIKMLCCLFRPTEGTARVMGYDIVKEPFEVKEIIGVSPQETAISERLNSWENLSLVGRIYGLSSGETKKRSLELLEIMGLAERGRERTFGLLHQISLLIVVC